MISISNKRKCTGCGACASACPVNAIRLEEDTEGFRYPKIELEKCINCGKCNRVCPFTALNSSIPDCNIQFQPCFFAGQLRDKADLTEVSSGGAFWALCMEVLNSNGVVYGAVQENVDHIYHIRASTLDTAQRIRRSKYFQSDVGNCYSQVKKDLKDGLKVLFSGTACQIAGLNTFLGQRNINLYTCDVVCHGVPSMKAWRLYRKEYEDKTGEKIASLVFRDKTAGWSKNQYCITHEDGSVARQRSTQHLFHAGYLQGLFYRPSCGTCKFSKLPRVSDITLADYWKYEGDLHGRDNDVGVSLIVVNNEHGLGLLHDAEKYLVVENTTSDLALSSCKHLNENPTENPDRSAFFHELELNGYYSAAKKFIRIEKDPSFIRRIINKILRVMRG